MNKAETVKRVQRKLKELGYYSGEIDGRINDLMARAIIRYKRATGIFPNNMLVDMALLNMLHLEIDEKE